MGNTPACPSGSSGAGGTTGLRSNSVNIAILPIRHRLFFLFPHLTRASIYQCNEWFYEVEYEDQICLSRPFQSVCKFS